MLSRIASALIYATVASAASAFPGRPHSTDELQTLPQVVSSTYREHDCRLKQSFGIILCAPPEVVATPGVTLFFDDTNLAIAGNRIVVARGGLVERPPVLVVRQTTVRVRVVSIEPRHHRSEHKKKPKRKKQKKHQ